VSLGASFSYMTGDFSRRFRWQAEDVNGLSQNYDEYVLSTLSSADVSGLRAKVGGLFYLADGLTGALVVETPTTLTFDGSEQVSEALDGIGSDPAVTYFSDEVDLPFSFGAGLSYTPMDFLLVAADAVYTDWSEMTYAGPLYLGDSSGRRAAYEATTDLRLGAELTVPSWPLRLRGGYGTQPLAYRGLEVDKDRAYFTLGAGVLIDTVLAIDLAWMSGSYERSGIGYDFSEAVSTNTFVLEGTYRF
jgi:long-subunit fatty acid transport protein